ncbi:MAG: M15 family metallopeptidase [Bacteroidales bacterium]|nr:M15 family metallopeptidase [Bacteroidales bacterium]
MNALLYTLPVIAYFVINKNKSKIVQGDAASFKTWDKYTNQRITNLHPSIRTDVYRAIQELQRKGINVRIASGYRSFKEQNEIFAKVPKVTKAQGGQSYHNYGLAVDVYEIKSGKLYEGNRKEIAAVFKKFGFDWGGDWPTFKDYPHFQKTVKGGWRELLKKQKAGKLKNGYVII